MSPFWPRFCRLRGSYMDGKRSGCDQCLIRNVLLVDQVKNGVVNQRAFKDNDPNGLSMTETRDRIIGLDDLDDYVAAISDGRERILGVAVFEAESAWDVGLRWRSEPTDVHRYGYLHVLGPRPEEMTNELRRECARLANLTGWSRAPRER